MKPVRILLALTLASLFLTAVQPSAAQTGTTFESFETENDFPRSLTFKTAVTNPESDIVKATLVFHLRNEFSSNSITRVNIEFDPGQAVELSYTWDTSAGTIPGAAIVYYWEVTDASGVTLRSHEITVRYEDTRFEWQVQENENIAVWWHDRRASFGRQVFEIASQAVENQRELYSADLNFQIRIIIYNSFDEFAEWNGVVSDFIGGQAFPNQGITAQIVSSTFGLSEWLNDVVPHEISHLYFAQVTFNRRSQPPTWLDEGLAQFNENGSQDQALRTTGNAAQSGSLISLSKLENGFGYFNEERTRLAYAEAVSAVTFLVEQYGRDGLAALLAAYGQGQTTEEAFVSALGVAPGTFEQAWAGWLGLDASQYATPTSWPLPTFPASPTPMVRGTAVPGTPGANTPTPPATSAAIAQVPPTPRPLPTLPPVESDPQQFPISRSLLAAVLAGLVLVGCFGAFLVAFLVWLLGRHKDG